MKRYLYAFVVENLAERLEGVYGQKASPTIGACGLIVVEGSVEAAP